MWYGVKQGLKNIRYNGVFSMASIGTITACLFLFGIFYFVISNFQYMIRHAETSVGVTVFFDEGVDESEIGWIRVEVQKRPEVDKVNYVSAEEAWEKFKEDVFRDAEGLSETFSDDNPLQDSASIEVYLNDVSKQTELVEFIEGMDGVRQVNSSEGTASMLQNVNRLVAYASVAILLILLAVSIFLISTTVTTGISVRREEIKIMKLLGATDGFIKTPFVVEGLVIGLVGACIPIILLLPLYQRMVDYAGDRFELLAGYLVFLEPSAVFSTLIPLSLLIGLGIGLLGSIWTVQRHSFV